MYLSIDVSIHDNQGSNLRISEHIEVEEMNYDEMGDMLKGFHVVVEAIKKAKGKANE